MDTDLYSENYVDFYIEKYDVGGSVLGIIGSAITIIDRGYINVNWLHISSFSIGSGGNHWIS